MPPTHPRPGRGPFRVDQLREGDRYELSEGHAIYCAPAGGRHGTAHVVGPLAIVSDPAVESVGTDVGHALEPGTLRAPDISVGHVDDAPGWVPHAPLLAVEYADAGTDTADLAVKIRQLLAAGTRYVWVVRLTGPRRVEVHTVGPSVQVLHPGERLEAPGVLQNPLLVEALYDRGAAFQTTLTNLLQREGYASLDAVRAEGGAQGEARGEAHGRAASVLAVFAARGIAVPDAVRARVLGCTDLAQLDAWVTQAATATSADALAPGAAPAPPAPPRRAPRTRKR